MVSAELAPFEVGCVLTRTVDCWGVERNRTGECAGLGID